MDEAIDRTQATGSPEELALHFLLRHAECRNALTGQTSEERPYVAPTPPRLEVPAALQVATISRQSEERLPSDNAEATGVTEDDSCTARFLRAYAVARHMRAEADTSRRVQTATMASSDAESDLKKGYRSNVQI